MTQQLHYWVLILRNENLCSYKNVHSSFISNSPRWKLAQCPLTGEWLNLATLISWNTTQEQKGRNYWYMQQWGWISRELCWVKNPIPKDYKPCDSIYRTFMERQNYRCVEWIRAARPWGWGTHVYKGSRCGYRRAKWSAMVWMFVSPQNACWYILTPKDDHIRKWDIWEVLRSWEWSPQEWMRWLIKEAPEGLLALSTTEDTLRRLPAMNQEEASHWKVTPVATWSWTSNI